MLTLIHDRVLIKRIPMPSTTKGGIYLPLIATELPQLGHIHALGTRNPDGLRLGDLVLVKKFEGVRLYLEDIEYYLFYLDEILAVVRD